MALEDRMETNALWQERKITWTMNNFSKLPDLVESAPFFPMTKVAVKWEIVIEFKFVSGSGYYCMMLGIKNVTDDDMINKPLKAVGKFTFKDSDGRVIDKNNAKSFDIMINKSDNTNIAKLKYSYKLPSNVVNVFALKDDIFILECDMTVSGIATSSIIPAFVFSVSNNCDDAKETLKLMYQKSALFDFTINIGEEKILAHKLILSVRSPIFEKMFEHETLEKKSNSMTLEDASFDVFNAFVEYLYTWEIDENIANDLEMLLELYEVADKYQLQDLQEKCAQILLTKFLNTENVCKILEVADMHKDEQFKKAVMQFFHQKFHEIRISPEWKEFLKKNVQLATDAISHVMPVANIK